MAGSITFASAVSGFPPLAIVAVLAGSLRMNMAVFFTTVLTGRIIRFWLVIEGASVIKDFADRCSDRNDSVERPRSSGLASSRRCLPGKVRRVIVESDNSRAWVLTYELARAPPDAPCVHATGRACSPGWRARRWPKAPRC